MKTKVFKKPLAPLDETYLKLQQVGDAVLVVEVDHVGTVIAELLQLDINGIRRCRYINHTKSKFPSDYLGCVVINEPKE